MIADLKPYPEYKDSGLPWLGRVPSHWEVRQARHVGRMLKGSGGSKADAVAHGVPCVRYGELYTTHNNFIKRAKSFVTEDCALTYTAILYGDVLFAASGEKMEEIGKSAVNLLREPAVCGGDVIILRPFDVSAAAFLGYATDSHGLAYQKATMGRGTTIKHVYPDELRNLTIPLPPPSEQAAIVRFLDWANGRLERAIRAKRKVIALLHEQKQAIIHKAVTQGLDPKVPKRDSGIPWLGEIPSHWEVRRLKHCTTLIEQGWSPQCDAQPAEGNEWGVLKVGCVNKDTFRPEQNKKLPEALRPDLGLEIRDGDILVSRANTRELLGLAALAEKPPAKRLLCDKLFRFRAKREVFDEKFLVFVLRSKPCRQQIESSTNGASTSMQNIGQGVLKNLWLASPNVAEQKQIVIQITAATRPITAGIDRYEREITLLREYRTRLVADVVTGKLDVREVALSLPEEDVVLASKDVVDEVDEPELEEGEG